MSHISGKQDPPSKRMCMLQYHFCKTNDDPKLLYIMTVNIYTTHTMCQKSYKEFTCMYLGGYYYDACFTNEETEV